MQDSLERARKQADEARRGAEAQRRKLEADLRTAQRKPASGRAHDIWRTRSAQVLDGQPYAGAAQAPAGSHAGELPAAVAVEAPQSARHSAAGSLLPVRRRSDTDSSASYRDYGSQRQRGSGAEAASLTSYQKRLAEIRANR